MTDEQKAEKIEQLQARLQEDISAVERRTIITLLTFFGVDTSNDS